MKPATPKSPVILGMDMVSPLGTDMAEQWRRAAAGESGVGELTRFPLPPGFPVRVAGQVDEIDTDPYPFLRPRALALWPSPIFKYSLLTAHRALKNSGIDITPEIAPRTAVTFSSAVGGLDAVLSADRRMREEEKLPPPYANPNSCINMVGGKVAMLVRATGPITATITACATGLTSMTVGAMLMAQGRADVVIAGAADFALVAPIVAGFATMHGAFQHRPEESDAPPARASRPFSKDRRGFVVSEGAACVVMATAEFAKAHGLKPLFEMTGWSMTADAHHYVAPNHDTVRRCMAEAIADAGLSPARIDAVNAHAASTKVGDKVECEALQDVFDGKTPPLTANKSLTGHAMGASSVIESILAMEGMRRGLLSPTINYTPDPELPMDAVSGQVRALDQEYVLKNAFGFGGCNACAVFRNLG